MAYVTKENHKEISDIYCLVWVDVNNISKEDLIKSTSNVQNKSD